jgi:ATP-binding cassette, subfamily F, member 3
VLTLSDVEVTFGARTLFSGVTVQITPGTRTALVGRNGSGKTTLLEILAGERDPDAGEVARAKGTRVGYLRQEVAELSGRDVLDEVIAGSPLTVLGDEVATLLARIDATDDAEGIAALVERLGPLQARFEQQGGYGVEAEARAILAGLGFDGADLERDIAELSGGWRMRVVLARLLLARPDVLLLDEPTNHLDLESLTWLEGFITGYEGALVIVSHDRVFMNNVVDRVVELAHGRATTYVGDYDAYVEQRELRREQLEAAARNQQRKIEQTERFIERFRAKNTIATRVQSRIKQLERMERIELPPDERALRGIRFPAPPRPGRIVVELAGVVKRYGDNTVYDGLDVAVERGQKVALVGPNGAGKSTLLRILAGVEPFQAGERRLGHNVEVAYYAQHTIDALDLDRTILEELTAVVDTSQTNPRGLAGAFLFSGDDVDKPVRVLSGGERARLALAKLVADPVNLLCMDEPTNHLDIPARDVVEEALVTYPGTIVLITHDRHLIRAVADTVFEVRDGQVRVHLGSYDDLEGRAPGVRGVEEREVEAAPTRDDDGERKRREAERRNRIYRATRELRDAVGDVEQELGEAEGVVARVNRLLADPTIYGDEERVRALVAEHSAAKDRAADLMRRWETLSTELEEATARVERGLSR